MMTTNEALSVLLRNPPEIDDYDCVDLVLRYLELLRGEKIDKPDCALSVKAVSAVLGKPKRSEPERGDVVLHKGGMGIHMGYCLLTVDEHEGAGRLVLPNSMLAWSV